MTNLLIASMVLAIWLYLLIGRGAFWRGREFDDAVPAGQGVGDPWPAVTAVIPARDEAESVGQTVSALLRQDYPGAFSVIVVDDQSRDGTAQVAREAAVALGAADRLTILSGRTAAGGVDGQALGATPGRRSRRGRAAAIRLSPPDRCRHRLRPG